MIRRLAIFGAVLCSLRAQEGPFGSGLYQVMERAACRFNTIPSKPNRLEIAGLCMRPVRIETGAAMNTVMK